MAIFVKQASLGTEVRQWLLSMSMNEYNQHNPHNQPFDHILVWFLLFFELYENQTLS
jgi:hypothetical protein